MEPFFSHFLVYAIRSLDLTIDNMWLGLVGRYSIPLAFQIMSKGIGRE